MTREAPKPAPMFLHFDSGVEINPETHEIIAIGGKPFDPEKLYQVHPLHALPPNRRSSTRYTGYMRYLRRSTR